MNAHEKKNIINLKGGPCKMDLMNALAYAMDRDRKFTVEFLCEDGERLTVRVYALSHEDGSGQSFNGKCHIVMRSGNPETIKKIRAQGIQTVQRPCDFYFHCGSRKGWIDLEPAVYLPGHMRDDSQTHQ